MPRRLRPQPRSLGPRPFILAQLALALLTLAAALLSLRLHDLRFSSVDTSPLIDGAWRLFSGQRAGLDFIGTFPASLDLLGSLAFHLFGVSWRSFGLAASGLATLLSLLGLRLATLLRSTLGRPRALLLAAVFVAVQLTSLLSINYPWHASMAEQIGCWAVLSTFALLTLPRAATRHRAECLLHLAPALALLLLSKPNTAFPTLLLCVAVLLRAPLRRSMLIALAALTLALALPLLRLARTSPAQLLLAYRGLHPRWLPKPLFSGILYHFNFWAVINLAVLLLLLPLLGTVAHRLFQQRPNLLHTPALLLGAGAILISLLGFWTNYDFKLTDTPLLLLGSTLLLLTLPPPHAAAHFGPSAHPSPFPDRPLLHHLAYAVLALTAFGLFLGATRARLQSMGQWGPTSCGPLVPLHDDPFFPHLQACAALPATLAEVDHALRLAPPHPRVFFGPQLEFLYARQHLPSPLGLPLWWDPGTSFPLSALPRIRQSWRDDRFDLVILQHGGALPVPALNTDLHTDFELLPGTREIDVYRRLLPTPPRP